MKNFITPCVLFVAGTLVGCGDNATEDLGSAEAPLSLPGSQFEIDSNANLIVDVSGNLDWATVADTKKADTPSGQRDDSYKGGSKEDDPCPGIEDGSIPNNKSDLKNFGAYVEPGGSSGDPGYLHVFWSRVQDPSGTTLMDFEFNQSSTGCGNGVNTVRTQGDFLLEYRLEQGGATAALKLRTWSGTAWGTATDLTVLGAATGTINSTAIAAANSDGLGAHDPRTFGEASVDLDFIFQSDKCVSFGSAFVKSRSSDSFTSALKDFIAPMPISITNCGKVTIRKQTDPAGLPDSFTFTHDLQTVPAQASTTFELADDGVQELANVRFGTGYTVTEAAATGFDLSSIDCSASSGVTPGVDLTARRVTFDVDDASDNVDCTFTNRARGTVVIEKITSDGSGTFGFTSSLGAFSLTTTGAGVAGKGSRSFPDLLPGNYDASETVPAGWALISATCSDGSAPSAIAVGAGETVTCTFVNARVRGAIRILKTRKHAASGPGSHPHAGVTFAVSGGELGAPVAVVTDANGQACVGNLVLSSFVGNYSVTETVPSGYVPDASETQIVAVTSGASCPAGNLVTFGNTPLTNLTVSVDSQVPGGTFSTITCGAVTPFVTDNTGDGSLLLANLVPGIYSCTIVIDP